MKQRKKIGIMMFVGLFSWLVIAQFVEGPKIQAGLGLVGNSIVIAIFFIAYYLVTSDWTDDDNDKL